MPTKSKKTGDRAVACGRSVFVVEKEGSVARLEIRDFRVVEKLLGKHLFPAFVRAFNGIERLEALAHFMLLNDRHVDEREHASAFERNRRTVNYLMHGALYECVDAIRLLNQAGVAAQVREDSTAWPELKTVLRRWERNDVLKKMRHGFAHHLGDREQIDAGLELFRTGKTMTIFDATQGGPYPTGCSFPFVTEILLGGSGIREAEFEDFVIEALGDQLTLRTLVCRLFVEVLIFHGVNLEID